jgi:uncharacterized damage-inducible protein DinB
MNTEIILTPEELFEHWQGHRRLTRRVIDAFPEDKLFSYSIGGMRPFSEIARELLGIAGSGITGIATRNWDMPPQWDYNNDEDAPKTKADLLSRWDAVTREIDKHKNSIPPGRFREEDAAWGQYEGTVWSHICYFIDNENHHRGQGYVYLRALNIEPPYFWERE